MTRLPFAYISAGLQKRYQRSESSPCLGAQFYYRCWPRSSIVAGTAGILSRVTPAPGPPEVHSRFVSKTIQELGERSNQAARLSFILEAS
jgi:hypothetical protein